MTFTVLLATLATAIHVPLAAPAGAMTVCDNLGRFGKDVMILRQMGVPQSEAQALAARAATGTIRRLAGSIVDKAYAEPIYMPDDERVRAALAYGARVRRVCEEIKG